jgi:hypothetical protein
MGAAAGWPGCDAARHGCPAAVTDAGGSARVGRPPRDGWASPRRTPHGLGGASWRGTAWLWGATSGQTPAAIASGRHSATSHSLPRESSRGRDDRTDFCRLCRGAFCPSLLLFVFVCCLCPGVLFLGAASLECPHESGCLRASVNAQRALHPKPCGEECCYTSVLLLSHSVTHSLTFSLYLSIYLSLSLSLYLYLTHTHTQTHPACIHVSTHTRTNLPHTHTLSC